MLRDKVFNIVESFLDKAGSKSIELLLDMDDSVPHYVSGDALRLELILKNLLDNAIMFTDAGRVVFTVRASSCPPGLPVQDRLDTGVNSSVMEQGQLTDKPKKRSAFFDEKPEPYAAVYFSIQDTGPGMEQEVLSDIFEPFYQKYSSMNRPRKGIGLGLTIAGEIIKMMGSDIKVQSSPGHGSTFSFTLNMAIDCGEKLAREAYQNIQTGTNVQTGLQMANAETILVADDRTFNREIMRDILGYGEYRVVLAGDGAEAFDFFCQRHLDLVILDWHMPLMDGIKTAEQIRRREFGLGLVPVPIIVISSDLQADCMAACKKSNILDILPKPLVPTKLLAAVSRNLHQRPFDEDALNVSMQIVTRLCQILELIPRKLKNFIKYCALISRKICKTSEMPLPQGIIEPCATRLTVSKVFVSSFQTIQLPKWQPPCRMRLKRLQRHVLMNCLNVSRLPAPAQKSRCHGQARVLRLAGEYSRAA